MERVGGLGNERVLSLQVVSQSWVMEIRHGNDRGPRPVPAGPIDFSTSPRIFALFKFIYITYNPRIPVRRYRVLVVGVVVGLIGCVDIWAWSLWVLVIGSWRLVGFR